MLGAVSSGLIEVLVELVPSIVSCTKMALGIRESIHKEREKELENAKISLEYDKKDLYVSPKLYQDILRISRGSCIMEVAYTSVAVKTGKLILYTLYYLTDPDAKKLMFDEDDCAFINAVAEVAGVRKIYETADIAEIAKYDSKYAKSDFAEPYILSIDDLIEKVRNDAFQQKVRTKMGMMMISDTSIPWLSGTVNGINGRVDSDGMIHPVFFSDEPMIQDRSRVQSNLIPEEVVARFETTFSPFFDFSTQYFYSTDDDGAYTLNIIRDYAMGAVDSYIIDDGSLLGGNNVSILGSFIDQYNNPNTLFISVYDNPEIVRKLLNNRFYILDNYEVMSAVRSFFNNTIIYRNIDFSNTSWYDSLNWDQRNILERRLGKLIQYTEDARFRFTTFSSVDSFTLLSDSKVKSQLRTSGATSSKIIEGMTVVVNKDFADIYVDGKSTRISLV